MVGDFVMVKLGGERVYEPDLEVELDLYYAYDPDLEVELELTHEPALALATIAITDTAALDDEWFGAYDETREYVAPFEAFDDQPTSPFKKLGNWLLRRAA